MAPGRHPPPSMPCDACGTSEGQLRRCSRCRSVAYCSQACQRAAWKAHKRVCGQQVARAAPRRLPFAADVLDAGGETGAVLQAAGLVLRPVAYAAGRGVFAERDIPAGTVLLRERPWVHSLREGDAYACDECLLPAVGSARVTCAQCPVGYCSAACRDAAKDVHLGACPARDGAALAAFWDACDGRAYPWLALGAFVRLARAVEADGAGGDVVDVWRRMGVGHLGQQHDLSAEARAMSEREVACLRAVGLLQRTRVADVMSADSYADLIALFNRNCFRVDVETPRPASAVGLYRTASLFNHACDKNVDKVFSGLSLALVVNRDVRAGEELTLDYVGEDVRRLPFAQRAAQFLELRGHACACAQCRREANE